MNVPVLFNSGDVLLRTTNPTNMSKNLMCRTELQQKKSCLNFYSFYCSVLTKKILYGNHLFQQKYTSNTHKTQLCILFGGELGRKRAHPPDCLLSAHICELSKLMSVLDSTFALARYLMTLEIAYKSTTFIACAPPKD